ncbi:hypothetical protein ACRRTK_007954 [Alexandromys fortis]
MAIGLRALRDPPSRAPIGRHVGKVALLTSCPAPLRPALHFRLRVASPPSASGRAPCRRSRLGFAWRASSRLGSSRGHVARPHRPGVPARRAPSTAP